MNSCRMEEEDGTAVISAVSSSSNDNPTEDSGFLPHSGPVADYEVVPDQADGHNVPMRIFSSIVSSDSDTVVDETKGSGQNDSIGVDSNLSAMDSNELIISVSTNVIHRDKIDFDSSDISCSVSSMPDEHSVIENVNNSLVNDNASIHHSSDDSNRLDTSTSVDESGLDESKESSHDISPLRPELKRDSPDVIHDFDVSPSPSPDPFPNEREGSTCDQNEDIVLQIPKGDEIRSVSHLNCPEASRDSYSSASNHFSPSETPLTPKEADPDDDIDLSSNSQENDFCPNKIDERVINFSSGSPELCEEASVPKDSDVSQVVHLNGDHSDFSSTLLQPSPEIIQNGSYCEENLEAIAEFIETRNENLNSCEVSHYSSKRKDRFDESPEPQKSLIKYKGYRSKLCLGSEEPVEESIVLKPSKKLKKNPFSSAHKKDSKKKWSGSCEGVGVEHVGFKNEYQAQYLGLQPTVKFKCPNCGVAGFPSMNDLYSHQVECKKSKPAVVPSTAPVASDSKSTNIKVTRKVFLCSACGTYYENWNLFLHMHEVHKRHICLFCLHMATVSEKLKEHLLIKHKVEMQEFPSFNDFKKLYNSAHFLVCVNCDCVMNSGNSLNHTCPPRAIEVAGDNTCGPSVASTHPDPVLEDLDRALESESMNEPCAFTQPETSFETQYKSGEMCQNNSGEGALADEGAGQQSEENVLKDPNSVITGVADEPMPVDHHDDSNMENPINENLDTIMTPQVPVSQNILSTNKSIKNKSAKARRNKRLPKKNKGASNVVKQVATYLVPDHNQGTELPGNPAPAPELVDPTEALSQDVMSAEPAQPEPMFSQDILPNSNMAVDPESSSNLIPSNAQVLREHDDEFLSQLAEGLIELGEPKLLFGNKPNIEPQSVPVAPSNEFRSANNYESSDVLRGAKDVIALSSNDIDRSKKKNIFRLLPSQHDSDDESDDSLKLSVVVDENTNVSDSDMKKFDDDQSELYPSKILPPVPEDGIYLAGDNVPAMALALDDKVDNVKIQSVVKECVRTSCTSCSYCRHAVKIAVNGKKLALHLLSEHRYTPIKNETCEDVIRKLKSSLDILKDIYFNTETYDSSDLSPEQPAEKLEKHTFDCLQCSFVTTSHRDLVTHKKKFHPKSLLLCIMCKSNFYSYSELVCHLCPGSYDPLNTDIAFRCCHCKLGLIPSAFRLMVHLRKCHHTCDFCLEICTDQQKLSTHMWKHKLNHLCYRCGIAYASKPDITRHLFWKHGTESVLCKKCLQKKWPHVYHFCIPPSSFICEECNASFSKAVALKVHKRIHAGDFQYKCTQCDKKFVSKKLLQRHEDRHNLPPPEPEAVSSSNNESKDEIINVTDVLPDQTESSEAVSPNKDSDVKEKHKKHKKDKEKKSKKVVDVYDLPPLNLSSESDSSNDDEPKKSVKLEGQEDINATTEENLPLSQPKDESVLDPSVESAPEPVPESAPEPASETIPEPTLEPSSDSNNILLLPQQESTTPEVPELSSIVEPPAATIKEELLTDPQPQPELQSQADSLPLLDAQPSPLKEEAVITQLEVPMETPQVPNESVQGIWENFYKTSMPNTNLPYPLCAMKPDDAFKIIMGDHDYCIPVKPNNPVITEDIIPSASKIEAADILAHLDIPSLKNEDLPELGVLATPGPPPTSQKKSPLDRKKSKSPKKKTPNKANSSSSSDSSSGSDTSSCTCGTNCSCSSSTSSSSSSSSDSDSSSDGKNKIERRKKRKEKKIKVKANISLKSEPANITIAEPSAPLPLFPEDPPIRESELETDETSTDEEFYDREPQKKTNQLLAEKRNQLMLLASIAPLNNGDVSPTVSSQDAQSLPTPGGSSPKKRGGRLRKRGGSSSRPRKGRAPKSSTPVVKSLPVTPLHPKFPTPTRPFKESPLPKPTPERRKSTPAAPVFTPTMTPQFAESAVGSGSESEGVRSSKRKRVPNKFYGYSSGEEDEKPVPPVKVKRPDPPPTTPKIHVVPPVPPPTHFSPFQPLTPRIQLTLPKPSAKKKQKHMKSDTSSMDSYDSPLDFDHRPQKTDKNVYCYCRCPYDEVSEMIACDDQNCKIEWFHFECVGIHVPPRGEWFCPECRKRRGLPP